MNNKHDIISCLTLQVPVTDTSASDAVCLTYLHYTVFLIKGLILYNISYKNTYNIQHFYKNLKHISYKYT